MQTAILAQNLFFSALAILALGAVGSLFLGKSDAKTNWWGNGSAILASISGLASSLSVLLNDSVFAFRFDLAQPFLSATFRVDRLSAFFIFIISLLTLLASIYSLGYLKHYYGKYKLGGLGFFYNAFIAGMLLVVSADNIFFFLIAWELMSLTSYFLVIFENKNEENIKAGNLYFIMTHIGAAFIIAACLLLYRYTGALDFSAIRAGLLSVSPAVKNIVFILALIGFGSKAGIIPFHIWLPSAHPAAPSHVSALMSGVMIKTGIYMLIRLYFDIMPDAQLWWGAVILAIGSISALLGVLYALAENDIKKLLAYSSIENIGIILLGLGSALVFFAFNLNSLAILGLLASLFHILNHAVFKALLFMGAGSVIGAIHTRNMEAGGGLIKRMPQTAFFFLVGALAISALPPFNGFFSEYLAYQTLLDGIRQSTESVRWMFILAAGALALTGGLAAACFVKAFGTVFLARPRSEAAEKAQESGFSLRFSLGVLATLTLLIGLFSGSIAKILGSIATGLNAFAWASLPFETDFYSFQSQSVFASLSMPLVLACLVSAVAGSAVLLHFLTKNRKLKIARTWDCGIDLGPRMEISAAGFSHSIIRVFKGILAPTKQTEIEYKDAALRYFPNAKAVRLEIKDVYTEYFYGPIARATEIIADKVKKIQGGNVNIYILYIFMMLVALLASLVF